MGSEARGGQYAGFPFPGKTYFWQRPVEDGLHQNGLDQVGSTRAKEELADESTKRVNEAYLESNLRILSNDN